MLPVDQHHRGDSLSVRDAYPHLPCAGGELREGMIGGWFGTGVERVYTERKKGYLIFPKIRQLVLIPA